MGNKVAIDFTAFNYGYISPKLRGRVDLDFYNQSLDYLLNYVVTAQGEANLRPGSIFVSATRGDKKARLIPFLYNTEQAYIVELTDLKARFYKDHGLITQTPLTITGITQANPGVLTYTGTDPSNGDAVFLSEIGGMTQLNQVEVFVANVNAGANTFELVDINGANINTSAYSAYTSGGTAAVIVEVTTPYTEAQLFALDYTQTNDTMYIVHPQHAPRKLTRTAHTAWSLATFSRTADPFNASSGAPDPDNWPSIVTLFEGRIFYFASDEFPTRFWFSKSGDLDNMTTGTNADDAGVFTVRSDQANRIRWAAGAEDYLAFGTSGSEFRIAGGGSNDAITPTNISVKPTSFNGVSQIRPIRLDSYILFAQRNAKTIRSYEYNALQDGYTSPDRTLLADHIGTSKFTQFAFTAGTPNIIWATRTDGRLAGLTFDPAQQVVAWHQHKTAGKYISIATIPEENDDDELWTVVQRTINGATKHYVEYIPNTPDIPIFEDYFTGESNKATDEVTWLDALWNVQKTIVHADSCLIYDGRDYATVALTITGGTTAGSPVVITAGGSYFNSGMVGRKIQTPNGGVIEITSYTSGTVVGGLVIYDLEASSFAIGEWYYMALGITGLQHLEGQEVVILADGGVAVNKTVSSSVLELDDAAGYVIIGLSYNGIGKTQAMEGGSENGRSQTKPKVVTFLGLRMRASVGTKFGTSLYNLESTPARLTEEKAGRPPRLYDGIIQVPIPNDWTYDKNIYWLHNTPTPSNIQYFLVHTETND